MITLIDNYDSFTYNLVQLMGTLGSEPVVYRNDQKSVNEVLNENPSAIVLSPGPSDPDHAGICLDLIKESAMQNIPLLGVCLGHQSIVQAFGGRVIRAPKPLHGKTSPVLHKADGLFESISSPVMVARYHSLIAESSSFPDCLQVTAHTEDGLIMALSHKKFLIYGVQFHPESIATEHGKTMMSNFLRLARV